MRHAPPRRVGTWLLLAGIAGGFGCTQNFYYPAPMTAGPVESAVGTGAVCEVPTQVDGGTLMAQGSGRTTVVSGAPTASRVIVSQPRDGGGTLLSGASAPWRRSATSSIATTRVDGALDSESTNR